MKILWILSLGNKESIGFHLFLWASKKVSASICFFGHQRKYRLPTDLLLIICVALIVFCAVVYGLLETDEPSTYVLSVENQAREQGDQ